MFPADLPDPELLKTLLEPLLEDFQYWLSRAETLLIEEDIAFLDAEAHADLLGRVEQTLQEVQATQSLFQAIGCQAGIDTEIIMKWHKLVAECWQVMIQFRMGNPNATEKR
ncbi:MAG: DUF2605 domain-containing protein [Thermosynechococcaceae cyanobacterium MS004]|nr:DUF2605 domain-containing protein [Thermosynechococcaceae cyanobacterium MS004]